MSSVFDIRPAVTPKPLSEAVSGLANPRLVQSGEAGWDTPVSGVTVNSNDIESGWVFVAIPGMVRHGIAFAAAACRKGASAIVTDEAGADEAMTAGLDAAIVVVDDPRPAGALIADVVYEKPYSRLLTMAVTGTNGKTTTSYLMRAALQGTYPNVALCGTVESRVGRVQFQSDQTTAEAPVIYRLLDFAAQQDLGAAIVETSSHAISLDRVTGIVFDIAAFTNLQHDHLDYYGDMENYFQAKKQLFTPAHSKQGVVCVDDEWGQRLAREAEVPVVTVSAFTKTPADWMVHEAEPDCASQRTVITLVDPQGQHHRVVMPILGPVNVQNTAIAIAAAVTAGLDLEAVIASVEASEQVPGRMEMVNPDPGNQPLVIVDYAHTPEGLAWTLKTVRELTPGRIVLCFGTDGDRDSSKREELGALAATEAEILWVTDENPRTEDPQSIRDYLLRGIASVRPDMHDVTEITTCRRDAVRKAILAAQPGDTIVIPGKGAEWYQDIDGIKHVYNDVPVAREVLRQDPRASL